jgi:16S rRNA (uracil1498-N3)-methyltransferase
MAVRTAPAMPSYDFHSPRLYLDAPLAAGTTVAIDQQQTHYLRNVLRLGPGDAVLAFNGREGEWQARIGPGRGRAATLIIGAQARPQDAPADLHYVFAPLKHARLDYVAQKTVEMGASLLQPVLTRHGQVSRVNLQRLRANAIEAAEQCGILTLPEIGEPAPLRAWLSARDLERLIVFCDESSDATDPVAALTAASKARAAGHRSLAVLVGPEGGFADDERALLARQPNVVRLALGPRILRADTAAVAALALVQAVLGDWR